MKFTSLRNVVAFGLVAVGTALIVAHYTKGYASSGDGFMLIFAGWIIFD